MSGPGSSKFKGQTFRLSNMGDETEETVAHLLKSFDEFCEQPAFCPSSTDCCYTLID